MMLRRLLTAFSFLTLVVAGCDCDTLSRLTIVAPASGATLTTDADPSTPGFQVDVTVRTTVLSLGETVRLHADASAVEADPNVTTPFTGIAGTTRDTVVRMTLTPGDHALLACAREECGVRSEPVDVTVDPGACPAIAFTAPALGTEPTIHLGPSDDQDGTPCGAEFTTNVTATVDAPDGTDVALLVNGVSAAMAEVVGGAVDFGDVVLGNRGDTPNSLEIALMDGTDCTAPFAKPVLVDCEGASCAITAPSPTTAFLNASNDLDSVAAGLQINVTVTSDADTTGETTHLILDGDDAGALDATAMAAGSVATSLFGGVTLTEGVRQVQAECEDAAGNITRSSVAMWNVDITACGVALSSPAVGEDIGTDDDLDLGAPGIQILATGTATGTDCTSVRAALCPAIDGGSFGTLTANAYSLSVTLGSAPSQDVCAEVRDAAGNVARAQAQVDVTSDAPQLAIVTPLTNTRYNVAGNPVGMQMHVADLDTGTDACDAAFTVNCEGVGTDVELVSGTTLLATASCAANGASPLGGRATFASVALPTASTSFTVFARQTVAGSTGLSVPVALQADCVEPVLSISAPACDVNMPITGADDTNSMLTGIQRPVTVSSPNTPQVDVTLTIVSTGGSLSYMATSNTAVGNDHVFSGASFNFAADFNVFATATDAFGNAGSAMPACVMRVEDLPSLMITTPAAGFVVNATNASTADCDSGTGGIQLAVSANTNATNGSAATIQIGVGATFNTTVTGGVISGCVDAPQGTSNITVAVNDTTTGDGVSGMAQAIRQVVVDTLPPVGTFSPTVMILDHRIAQAQLTFTALDDDGAPFAAYHLRCAGSVIDNEAKWAAATAISLPSAPLPGGQSEIFVLGSMANRILRTGVRYHCVLRAADAGGNVTPLPAANTEIYPAFETTLVDSGSATGTQMGYAGARALGDVNDDGFPDVLVTGMQSAFLYFGSATPPATDNPDVVFSRTGGGSAFGVYAAGIGDFDGDGIDDFAISDYNEAGARGGVYIFRGRASWPSASVTVGTAGCDADLCIRGQNVNDFLGYEVTALGDFDGDGDDDVGLGLSGLNQVLVLSGRSLATPTSITTADNPDGFVIQGMPTNVGSVDFGWAALGMGNITGSAHPDIVVLAAGYDEVTFTFTVAPKLYRVAGRTRGAAGLTTISGAEIVEIVTDRTLPFTMGQFVDRTSLGSADFDGDGDLDLAVREPATTNLGVRVFYNDGSGGFANAGSSEITAAVGATGDFFGVITASGFHPSIPDIGDVDGDGFGDVLAGAVQAGTMMSPAAGLVYGRATPAATIDWTQSTQAAVLSPAPATMPTSPPVASRLVGFVGDLDGDGFEDVVVTDHRANGMSPNGRIFVLH